MPRIAISFTTRYNDSGTVRLEDQSAYGFCARQSRKRWRPLRLAKGSFDVLEANTSFGRMLEDHSLWRHQDEVWDLPHLNNLAEFPL